MSSFDSSCGVQRCSLALSYGAQKPRSVCSKNISGISRDLSVQVVRSNSACSYGIESSSLDSANGLENAILHNPCKVRSDRVLTIHLVSKIIVLTGCTSFSWLWVHSKDILFWMCIWRECSWHANCSTHAEPWLWIRRREREMFFTSWED